MPLTPGAGFGYAVFGTDAFGDEPDTAGFTTKIEAEKNDPILRLTLGGFAYDDFIIDAPSVSRGADIIAGTVNIVLSNTPVAQIHGVGFAFVNASPASITDSNNGFVTAGFVSGDRITVSGSTSNDGTYHLDTVAAGTLTLITGDTLTGEAAGDTVSILAQPAFNFFVADRKKYMGMDARLSLLFSGTTGSLRLLTGTVEDVSYNGATITLSIRDKMAGMLEHRIGSGQEPANFYSLNTWGAIKTAGYNSNPAQLAWSIMTRWGGLDKTFSTDNIHIDFSSWDAWRLRCVAHNYEVRARFPGTTVQNALLRIGDMTNSFIWVGGEGKFKFTMFEPPYVAGAGDETYDADNSVDIDLDIEKSTVRNVITIYYGHNPDATNRADAIITGEIGFDNSDPDRIYLIEHNTGTRGFIVSGFNTDDPITVSGTEKNDGQYSLQTVANDILTLTASNGLTDEDAGASVTITQNQDTSTMRSTSLVFNDTGGNDTITDVLGRFLVSDIDANDDITIDGSVSNDGTYSILTVTANTITLDGGGLTQEPSGAIVILTQIHTKTYTATTIKFNDDETGSIGGDPGDKDNIEDSAEGFISAGLLPQYDITVSGSSKNNGTYELGSITTEENNDNESVQRLNLLKQSLRNENGSNADVTIKQSHDNRETGKQFEGFITVSNDESINLPGTGIRELTDETKVVWHDNLASAYAAGIARLLIYAFPGEFVRIAGTMLGFLTEPGDEIHVTEAHKNIIDQTYFVKGIDLDLEQGIANITAERGN